MNAELAVLQGIVNALTAELNALQTELNVLKEYPAACELGAVRTMREKAMEMLELCKVRQAVSDRTSAYLNRVSSD